MPKDKTYSQLTDVLKAHFNPKPSEIVQRFKFNSCIRKNNEPISDYVAELRKLAQHCQYGDALPQLLRDRLVCGVNEDRMQRRLLSEVDLTFDKALKFCQAMEATSKDVKDLQAKLTEDTTQNACATKAQATVHKVSADNTQRKPPCCYRCKGQHPAAECKFATELRYVIIVVSRVISGRPADPRQRPRLYQRPCTKARKAKIEAGAKCGGCIYLEGRERVTRRR